MANTPKLPPPRKAKGRTLAEFLPLRRAEQELLDACREGQPAVYGNGERLEDKPQDPQDCLRSDFVRFMCLGGDDSAPVHEFGVWIQGAWIESDKKGNGLDLESAVLAGQIFIVHTHIDGPVQLINARGRTLSFEASVVAGIEGDGLYLEGDLFLRNGFKSSGEVRLLGAEIGGSLTCSNGQFENDDGNALSCEGARIKGGAYLNDGFKATGAVRLLGAEIGGDLVCSNGQFENDDGHALSCDGARIKGGVLLSDGFKASGEVRLLGAEIGGDLDCTNGQFDKALICDRASIKGAFVFRSEKASSHPPLRVAGNVNLSSMTVVTLADDANTLQQGNTLILDGFRYQSIGSGPTDAATRIAWLKRQRPDHLTGDTFCPQPWTQLISVLRRMGHSTEADEVAIAFQNQRRAAGKITTRLGRALHWCFGLLAGYGYRPLRLLKIMLAVWFTCGALYWAAAMNGGFGPANPLVFDSKHYDHCKPTRPDPPRNTKATVGNWYWCKDLPGEYTTFQPWLYSLDLILPLVELQQDKDWAPIIETPPAFDTSKSWPANALEHFRQVPNIALMQPLPSYRIRVPWFSWTAGQFARVVMWFEILFGWIASLLLVAVLTGLTNREKKDEG